MKAAVIIPSRHASVRLPQKALVKIRGTSLVERVYRQVRKAHGLAGIYVATDHESIAHHVREFGGHALMTSPDCPSGTDRVAEAAHKLPKDIEIVINVQGDEPLILPEVITALIDAMRADPSILVATPVSAIRTTQELLNPNVVKVVRSTNGDALYFSRQAIPYMRDLGEMSDTWLARHYFVKHIGVYAYRRATLDTFVALGESSLERAERLEQLRLIEAGIPIRCVLVHYDSVAVDTASDVDEVSRILIEQGLD